MKGAQILLVSLVFVVIFLLLVYFFIPLNTIELSPSGFFKNASVYDGSFGESNLQFYDNMRYRDSKISYKIYDECSLKKKNDMEYAFEILSDMSVLEFYPVIYGEEISITCSDDNIIRGNTFVGGEGGVTNVTIAGEFNIIFNGKILLIRDSNCANPNIAIHELLHSLGFDHSQNPGNIMYDTSDCDQSIGNEIPDFLNKIYSVPAYPDLTFEGVDAVLHGKYLDANVSIRNNGVNFAPDSNLIIYADGKKIKEIEIQSLGIGFGRKITLTNMWVNKLSVEEIEFVIDAGFEELSKTNNEYVLSVKK
jgi:hypothetical protein